MKATFALILKEKDLQNLINQTDVILSNVPKWVLLSYELNACQILLPIPPQYLIIITDDRFRTKTAICETQLQKHIIEFTFKTE